MIADLQAKRTQVAGLNQTVAQLRADNERKTAELQTLRERVVSLEARVHQAA